MEKDIFSFKKRYWQFDQHFFNTFQHLSHKSCFFGSLKIHCFKEHQKMNQNQKNKP